MLRAGLTATSVALSIGLTFMQSAEARFFHRSLPHTQYSLQSIVAINSPLKSVADKGQEIVDIAKSVAKASERTAYTSGGKTLSGFDCSGFVYYVLHEVFPQYQYLTATQVASSPMFIEIKDPRSGDLVYFPPGRNPYEVNKGNNRVFPAHIGIIVDVDSWIGRQTNSIGLVQRTNVWWKARADVRYFRYVGATQTSLNFLQEGSQAGHA